MFREQDEVITTGKKKMSSGSCLGRRQEGKLGKLQFMLFTWPVSIVSQFLSQLIHILTISSNHLADFKRNDTYFIELPVHSY